MNQVQENNTPEIKINFKTLIILILFLIGIYFLIPRLIDAQEALKLIFKVNKIYLGFALLAECLSYTGSAILLGVILSRLGYKIPFWDRFRLGSIAAFAIHFFPVGSFGESAVDYYFLRKRRVEAGSILIMLILRVIITFIAFFTILLLALILVPTVRELPLTPKILAIGIFLVLASGIIYLTYLYQNKNKFRRLWLKLVKPINIILRRFKKPAVDDAKSGEVFEDIYGGLKLFTKKKRNFIFAVLAGLMYWLGDITCFFFVFKSFGYSIHFGVLMFSYGIGALAGMVSFIPGGLGVTEGTLALILTSLGTPAAVALMSILVFRLFSFWIWIPFGLYSFITLRKASK